MILADLIKKLQAKPGQQNEVEFLVFEKGDGVMVCADLSGPSTMELMKLLANKRKKGHATVE